MSSEVQSIKKTFNKLLKKYGTTVNVHYASKDSMGKTLLAGDYLGVKVLIDPLGVGLNLENSQYANIKSSKAVFYIPMSYVIDGVDTLLNFKDANRRTYTEISIVLPDNSFSWNLTAVSPVIAVGNDVIYQVGVQQ